MSSRDERLIRIILKYREELQKKIRDRKLEMESDNNDHYVLYNALGFTSEEGYQIDFQQNVGRFLYKYAGSLIEELAIKCFKLAHPDAQEKVKLPNTIDRSPKTVEIDCLIGKRAIEIKWKDATTDGDHIKKEHKRVRIIQEAGYIPIRIMFFEPNRDQAIRIQSKLRDLYHELGGEYYSGDEAWEYLERDTGIDLKSIIERNGK
ncbi:ApaLI family restriction endonuclease [Bariatricus sp. HCP28S3_E4]|uniref:ApaLI family restriction endonuclease n=1 Tax=Lachnospiraceae TaxID=186803 RepID=UPI002A86B8C9|nr:ApaLI family restriction endonuclease [Oliverpabstia sp.]